MKNQEPRTVTMNRSDMLRVEQALYRMVSSFRDEIADSETTETRRKIARDSMEMWERIRSEFERQLDEQDK